MELTSNKGARSCAEHYKIAINVCIHVPSETRNTDLRLPEHHHIPLQVSFVPEFI